MKIKALFAQRLQKQQLSTFNQTDQSPSEPNSPASRFSHHLAPTPQLHQHHQEQSVLYNKLDNMIEYLHVYREDFKGTREPVY